MTARKEAIRAKGDFLLFKMGDIVVCYMLIDRIDTLDRGIKKNSIKHDMEGEIVGGNA